MNLSFDRKELSENQEKLLDTSIFLAKFLAVGLVFRGILFLYPDTTALQQATANIVSWSLGVFGAETSTQSTYVIYGRTTYQITQDCLGWKSMAAFTGLILASGDRIERKHLFLIGGILAIFVANIIRIDSTILLSSSGIISYEIIHGTLWKWGLTLVILVLWLLGFVERGLSEPLNKRA